MLITAASPEIRILERSKTKLFTEEEGDIEEESEANSSKGGQARKAKSLGLLCQK